jgi:hypothetical protein
MKFIKLFILGLIVSTVFLSCKKDNTGATASKSLQGKWVGTYGFGNETPHVFYSFNIKASGVIEELSQAGNSKGSGTWNLNGNSFTATYQWKSPMNTVYSVVAIYDPATGKLTGTWGYDNNNTNGGLWEQSRQ